MVDSPFFTPESRDYRACRILEWLCSFSFVKLLIDQFDMSMTDLVSLSVRS